MKSRGSGNGNAFDLLRIAAALLVVVQHSTAILGVPHLNAAVSLLDGVGAFFVISGMFVFRSALSAAKTGGWSRYFRSRYFRVVPALIPFVVLVPFVAVALGASLTSSSGVQLGWWFLGPFIALPLAKPAFFSDVVVNEQLWTIPAEVSFYLVLPVLALLAMRFGAKRVIVLFVVTCVALEMAARWIGAPLPSLTHHTFVERGMFFGVGMWFAVREVRGSWVTAVAALVMYVALRFGRGTDTFAWLGTELCTPLVSVVAAALLGYVVVFVGTNAGRLERVTARIGDLSYGVYVWHLLVVVLVVRSGVGGLSGVVLSVTGAALLGAVSWWLVERPVLRAVRGGPLQTSPPTDQRRRRAKIGP